MRYSKVTKDHTENMSKIMREIGYKEAKKLLEEIYCSCKFNYEKFNDPNKLVKRLKKTIFEFDKTHFDYFVDVYNAKENPKYYNIGGFSEDWFEFIRKKNASIKKRISRRPFFSKCN